MREFTHSIRVREFLSNQTEGRAVKTGATKWIGIWLRVSTEDQVRCESPEVHEWRARLYAEAKGWEVAEVYRLDAVSGKR